MASAEAWIDLLLKRSGELRRAGVLSIGVDGMSAVLAPAEPAADASDDDSVGSPDNEPSNAWENPVSYPTGSVPTFGDVVPADELPEIPRFGDG